jgi:plastocyanin
MHNVHIKTAPKGARLGSASVSQYLTTKGQAYSLVVDARFVDGTYEVVCDPHEMVGMHAFISVSGKAGIANGK